MGDFLFLGKVGIWSVTGIVSRGDCRDSTSTGSDVKIFFIEAGGGGCEIMMPKKTS